MMQSHEFLFRDLGKGTSKNQRETSQSKKFFAIQK